MLRLFDTYASLFKSWRVIRYEQEGEAYLLQLFALLQDDSRLELRDYFFADGSRVGVRITFRVPITANSGKHMLEQVSKGNQSIPGMNCRRKEGYARDVELGPENDSQ